MTRFRVLTHFSEKPLTLDRKRVYFQPYDPDTEMWRTIGKPKGLWLSDENQKEDGWKHWCRDNDFHLEGLAHQKDFVCDTQDWCVLDSNQKMREFNQVYREKASYQDSIPYFKDRSMEIHWERVSKDFKGILISPYFYNLRFELFWYYGWDCASACVWDLSTIVEEEMKTGTGKRVTLSFRDREKNLLPSQV